MCCDWFHVSTGIGLVILWIAITINALDVYAAEIVLKYLTYLKLVTIGGATIIGFVYIAKAAPGNAAYTNLHDSFAGSGFGAIA